MPKAKPKAQEKKIRRDGPSDAYHEFVGRRIAERRGNRPFQAEECFGGGGTHKRASRDGAPRCRVRVATLAKAHGYKDTKIALVLVDVAKAPTDHMVA